MRRMARRLPFVVLVISAFTASPGFRLKAETTGEEVRLKAETTGEEFRLKAETTGEEFRLKAETTGDELRLKAETADEEFRLKAETTEKDQTEKLDYAAIARIRDEGLNRSQAMETLFWLTDRYGPRLTGSPAMDEAGAWTMKKMTEWDFANVHREDWDFGRSWALERFSAHLVSPQIQPPIGFPKTGVARHQRRGHRRRRPCRDRKRGRLCQIQGTAEGQDRARAAVARGPHARRAVHRPHGRGPGEGSRDDAHSGATRTRPFDK